MGILRLTQLLVLALCLTAAPAAAHSVLESSVPADGAVVREAKSVSLTFAAPVRLVALRLVVDGADVALEVDRTAAPATTYTIPLPELGEGRYQIKWTAIAQDGHDVDGSFSFAIAGATATVADREMPQPAVGLLSIVKTIVKAALYLSTLIAAGGVFFLALFAKDLLAAERDRLALMVRGAAVLALILTIARIMIAAASVGAGAVEWQYIQLVLDGSEGAAASVRAAGLVIGAIFATARGWIFTLALAAAVAAAASFALTGHTVSLPPGRLPQIAVALHLVALAYWVGALIPLAQLSRGNDLTRVARVAARFGTVALIAVGVLATAGLFLIWALLDLPEGLVASSYGQLMLVKLALVSLLLTLAAINKLRLTPRIEAGESAAAVSLRRSIAAEIALVVLIALTTAMFTTLTGPPNLH